MTDQRGWAEELDRLLESISYELTAARTAGVGRPRELRGIVRRLNRMTADLETLAASAEAARQEGATD